MTANLHLLDVVLCFCKSHLVQHTQFNCNLISKYNLCLNFGLDCGVCGIKKKKKAKKKKKKKEKKEKGGDTSS